MDERHIERALRSGPPDEPAYQPVLGRQLAAEPRVASDATDAAATPGVRRVRVRTHPGPTFSWWQTGGRIATRGRPRARALRLAATFGVLAVAVVVALTAFQGGRPALIPGASPSPYPSSAPVTLPAYSDELRCDAPGRDPCQYPRLQPSTYGPGDQFPLELTFAISGADTDWRGFAGPQFVFLHGKPLSQRVGQERTQVSLFIWAATDLFADPCTPSSAGRVTAGSSTGELLAALNESPCVTASVRGTTTFGAYEAAEVEVLWECEESVACPLPLIPTTSDDHLVTDLVCHDRPCQFLVLNSNPPLVARVVRYTWPWPDVPAVETELQRILDSLRLTPLDATR